MWVVWPGLDMRSSREAVYTAGFVAFWALGMFSSALALLLQRPQLESPPP
jgi:hypothetical protein